MKTGLFHTLHRVVKYTWIAILISGAGVLGHELWIYPPLRLWAEVLMNNKWEKHEFAGELNGKAVRVLAGDSFQMKENSGLFYSVRLTGLRAPVYIPARSNRAEREMAEASEQWLKSMILSNEVSVKVTVSKPGSALGVVFANGTNINARMLSEGQAVTRPQWIENLPLKVQYEMLRSEREARARRKGLWEGNATGNLDGKL